MRMEITTRLFVILTLSSVFVAQAGAQTVTPAPAPAPKATWQRKPRVTRGNPVIVQNTITAPQVVTILHGLNGLKVLGLLSREHQQAAIAKLDEAFLLGNEIHTNVIAGLALDDGKTVAVWLPEAEAEMPPLPYWYAPGVPTSRYEFRTAPPSAKNPPSPAETPEPTAPPAMPGVPTVAGVPSIPYYSGMPADLKVVTREGKRLAARYVGLDGLTGLSVITLADNSLPQLAETRNELINVGQRLRLIGPEPAVPTTPGPRYGLYVRLGETEATVTSVNRTRAGGVRRVKIKSHKLTPANMGGIAINDAGETLGIVDAVRGHEATVVPLSLVRSAVKRVVDRQASVPRPWLGIRGESIGSMSFERIKRTGWEAAKAQALAEKRQGILLTSVVPGSPAALAHLRPGDVILGVNNDEVESAEDFTFLLDSVDPGNSLKFTIARPEKLVSEALEIKLSESPDPFFGLRKVQVKPFKEIMPGSLLARGIETIALRPAAAVHFGATGGLLVVYVEPSTAAFKAGLKPGDVIQEINGQQVVSRPVPATLLGAPGTESTFTVVRNRKKMVITFPMK